MSWHPVQQALTTHTKETGWFCTVVPAAAGQGWLGPVLLSISPARSLVLPQLAQRGHVMQQDISTS